MDDRERKFVRKFGIVRIFSCDCSRYRQKYVYIYISAHAAVRYGSISAIYRLMQIWHTTLVESTDDFCKLCKNLFVNMPNLDEVLGYAEELMLEKPSSF